MNVLSNFVLVALLLWGGYSGWTAFRKAPKASAEIPETGRGSQANGANGRRPTEASRGWFSSAPVARKTATLRTESTILIYGPSGTATGMAEEALKFRGFTKSVVVPVDTTDQFQELGMVPALRAAGLVNSKGVVNFPFIDVDGELYSHEALLAGLSQFPLSDVREHPTPYITIYGPADCPFTRQGREELDANGIPYVVRDVNDPRYQPRFEALVRAYDFKSYAWPMIDINGKMFSKPSLDVVRGNYR